MKDNIITLHNEKGRKIKFEFLDLIEYNDKKYVVLLPLKGGQVVILRLESIETDNEHEAYIPVEDEAILSAVYEIFKEKFKDEFDFE